MNIGRTVSSVVLTLSVVAAFPGCGSAPAAEENETVAQTRQGATTVTCYVKNTCCASTAVGPFVAWDLTDPMQAQLSAWGCTKPRLYAPNQANNAWWYWTACTDPSQRVENLLATHPAYRAAPDLAVTSTTLDPACVPAPPAGSVDVLWDPTCPTCRVQ